MMQKVQFEVHADAERSHWWFSARRRILAAVLETLVPGGEESLVVDVGCGTGGNAAFLHERYRCVGLDPSAAAIELARRRFGDVRFLVGDSPAALDGEAGRAQAFLMTDVLEHVADDFLLLSEWLAAARPGSVFVLTVPADPALWSPHDESHGHYRRYDRQRFEAVWAGLPVTPLLVSHFNSRLYPLVKAVRTINRLRGKSSGAAGTDLRLLPRWLNALLGKIFAGECARLLRALRDKRSPHPDPLPEGEGAEEAHPGTGSEGEAVPYRRGVSLIAVLRRDVGEIVPRRRPAHVAADVHGPVILREVGSHLRTLSQKAPDRSAMKTCTMVIPCYNEAARLDVEAFRESVLQNEGLRFLFVDDGSADDTRSILEALCLGDPARLAVLALPHNVGKAEAVRRGMLAALEPGDEDCVGYWDADLATPLETIAAFRDILRLRGEVEIVIGSRVRLLGRRIERRPARHYAGRIFATGASWVLGLPVYDTQCGAKLFRASSATRRVFTAPFGSRWIFDVELLARFAREFGIGGLANAVCEYPLQSWRDVAGSKVRWRDGARAIVELAAIGWRYRGATRAERVEQESRNHRPVDHSVDAASVASMSVGPPPLDFEMTEKGTFDVPA